MGRKTKKFIDKKKAATFQLLARDSADAGESASGDDRVFVRVDNSSYPVDSFFPDEETTAADGDDSVFADAPDDVEDDDDDYHGGRGIRVSENHGVRTSEGKLPEHVRKEILELGFPDDGYNYLMHLREIKNTGGGSAFYHNTKARLDLVPKDVKAYDASRVQIPKTMDDPAPAESSMYNVAKNAVNVRAQKVFDPEVAALLDDSDLSRFGSDVEDLEEDFVIQANLPDYQEDVVDEKLNSLRINEMRDTFLDVADAASLDQERSINHSYVKEVGDQRVVQDDECVDEKPRVHRLLDEQFDMLKCQEYGSSEDDCDDNDYYGYGYEEEHLADKLKQTINDNAIEDLEPEDGYKAPADLLRENDVLGRKLQDSTTDLIHRCAEYAKKYENESEGEEVVLVEESSDESEAWDCETIISTFSNLDNHPGKIAAPEVARKKKIVGTISAALSGTGNTITLKGKEQLPVEFLPHSRKSTAVKVKSGNPLKQEQHRRKLHGQESKEEKKERKAAVKEERREARRVKKEMKGLYRCETQRAQKVAAITGPASIPLM